MHILSLLLLCIYTPSAFSAASSRPNQRRRKNNTMSLQSFSQHIDQIERQEKEYQQIINCVKMHEAKPCSNSAEFTVLKSHYTDLFARTEPNTTQWQHWRKCITQCNTRMNIMQDIEATEQSFEQQPQDAVKAVAMQEMHWLALKQTYQPDSEHFTFYTEQARLACERYKTLILNQDIARLLSQQTVSQDEYNNLHEKAETLFGDRAEQILAQLPETTKVAIRSIQTTLASSVKPQQSKKKIIRGINPHRSAQANLNALRRQATSLQNAKHLTPESHMAILAALYTNIAQYSTGIEKEQAIETAQHFKRMQRQIILAEHAHHKEQSLSTEDDYHQLIAILSELRNTYAIIDPNYEGTTNKIKMVERNLWYLIGDIHKLQEAYLHDTDATRKHTTKILINRLEKENRLADLLNEDASLEEQREAYLDLLTTYNTNEPEHQIYLNKIRQLDLTLEIQRIDTSHVDDLTYFSEHVRLRTQLAQTYEEDTTDYLALQQELEMYKALKVYTEAHNFALKRINQPISDENVGYLHPLIKDLYTYAQYVNGKHATTIKTDWMEQKLAEYAQHMTYYETISELKEAEQAPGDSRMKQQELLREIINSPITELSAKKEYLIQLIHLTDDVTTKLRIIRDELLISGTLDINEKIQWNIELAQLNLTRKIRGLREQLKTASISEQLSINKELAACIAKRNSFTHK